MKSNYFYNTQDIKQMKELIRTGEPLMHIAERECVRFNASKTGFYTKLLKVAKNTTKIREWNGETPLRRRKTSSEKPVERKMPEGFSFEGTPKKVTFCTDHFKVYF